MDGFFGKLLTYKMKEQVEEVFIKKNMLMGLKTQKGNSSSSEDEDIYKAILAKKFSKMFEKSRNNNFNREKDEKKKNDMICYNCNEP